MSDTRIPLNARALARLRELEQKVRDTNAPFAAAQQGYGQAIGAHLDTADIDAATVADVKIDGDALVVTTKDAETTDADTED